MGRRERNMSEAFFPPVTEKFDAVPLDADGVSTAAFLDACESILPLFDRMGSVFGQVKGDIGGNITKLRKSAAADEANAATLQKLVQVDIDSKKTTKSGSATESLLWLKRAFEFIILLLDKLSNTTDEMKVCANAAYEATLSKFHGWIIRRTFGAGLSVCGAKKEFLLKLGPDEAAVTEDMKKFLAAFGPKFSSIVEFYNKNGLEPGK